MLKVQRLNMDSSWFINWKGLRIIVDPWLMGSQVDGAKWINEQWHRSRPLDITDVPHADYILITQSFSDHCHIETLSNMDPSIPILATTKAFRFLKNKFPERTVKMIGEQEFMKLGDGEFTITCLLSRKIISPSFFAVVIANGNDAIFLSPHGFELNTRQWELIESLNYELLITTFTDLRVPSILGGQINPGPDIARNLIKKLKPEIVLNSHDEEKKIGGLMGFFVKANFPDFESIEDSYPMFVPINDYQEHSI